MKKQYVEFYGDCWYKVIYLVTEYYTHFEATKIDQLDEENIEESILEKSPTIIGVVRYDDAMDIKFDDSFKSFELFFDQFILLVKHIRNFAKQQEGYFGFDDKYSTI